MSESIEIQSFAGRYSVEFSNDGFDRVAAYDPLSVHYLIDANVARLYREELSTVLASPSVCVIEASERAKSLEQFPAYVQHLVSRSIRRHHRLIAIGGGVLQDITCFLAATLQRGLAWEFYPTTLLAQADSCIGSKSSINVGSAKNILGTFTPPTAIVVVPRVLKTLTADEMHSGIGEMLKVHAIDSVEAFDDIAAHYDQLLTDDRLLGRYIRRSLEIKKRLIELDEFDRGPRQVMNYGHTFGHAIESATSFEIPHGIAVSMGMDMANYVAGRLNVAPVDHHERMHPVLQKNFAAFRRVRIPFAAFREAIMSDKKNTNSELRVILPDRDGRIVVTRQRPDDQFFSVCAEYLESVVS